MGARNLAGSTLPTQSGTSNGREIVPLIKPDFPPFESLAPLFARVLESGVFSNFGPLVCEFEEKAAKRFFDSPGSGVRCVTTSSGTSALEIAIQAMQLPAGSRFVLPAYGFVAAACAVARLGHYPVFADVDELTGILTLDGAAFCIEKNSAAAVMVVSPFGYSIDADMWTDFSRSCEVPVVADVAAGLGNQRDCGGIPFIFSMHATKAFGIGEGGLIATSDEGLAGRLRSLSNFGLEDRIAQTIGGNAKMSEWHGAVALAQLSRWDEIVSGRQGVRDAYRKALSSVPAKLDPQTWSSTVPTYMPICMPSPRAAETAVEALSERGIHARRWFHPAMPIQPAFSGFCPARDARTNFPVADSLAACVVCLPFYAGLPDKHVMLISNCVRDAIGTWKKSS